MANYSNNELRDNIRDFMLCRGGKVTNSELVKHFKEFLTNPDNKVQARNDFKEIVNQVATVTRNENGDKYLILKRNSRDREFSRGSPAISPDYQSNSSASSSPLMGTGIMHPRDSQASPSRSQPPAYRFPPPAFSQHRSSSLDTWSPPMKPSSLYKHKSMSFDDSSTQYNFIVDKSPPPVPPRRKSNDKLKADEKENIPREEETDLEIFDEKKGEDNEGNISVKECMQKFNRLASEGCLLKMQQNASASQGCKKRFEKGGLLDRDEEDSVSVTSLDPKAREWIVRAAQGNYQALAKLALDNPRFARLKDPTTGYTALHWAAKHGNQDIIKLIAGKYGVDVNSRTHGGYTPLHIAMQSSNEDVFNLLVQVYGGNQDLRDWSGRKPRQYLTTKDMSISSETYRKLKAQKKHTEKDLGFLRIGSLNVRVKRTTEAVSNYFLGQNTNDKIHKTWSSADSVQDSTKMPPPKFPTVQKRKSKLSKEFNPTNSPRVSITSKSSDDSDSDFGFDANWKQT